MVMWEMHLASVILCVLAPQDNEQLNNVIESRTHYVIINSRPESMLTPTWNIYNMYIAMQVYIKANVNNAM